MHINLSDSKLYKPLRTISHCRLNNSENRGTAQDFSPKIIEKKSNYISEINPTIDRLRLTLTLEVGVHLRLKVILFIF